MTDVLLVSMPFGPVFWPSIGLSLLKAGLADQPVSVDVRYFTIPFAERIGHATYDELSLSGTLLQGELVGEWLFSHALFERSDEDIEAYVREILRERRGRRGSHRPVPARLIRAIDRVRSRVEDFLAWCADEVVRASPRVVGLTSVFQQHAASLALARRIRDRLPGTFIVMGGANCEGVMGAETLRQFPWIDATVSGEAELVFPDLVRRALDGDPVSGLQGIRTRDGLAEAFAAGRFDGAPPVRDMDALPVPDYRDFFEQFQQSRLGRTWTPGVLAETSRGCWWGERMHCTFCGLNGATMAFRSKSADRAIDELSTLAGRHPESEIQIVDNILDLEYFKTLLPTLAERRLNFHLFFETKSNLRKPQVRLLRDAGVERIQPGIESFSDPVLQLMRKGVRAVQNVQLLKWCKELGVEPVWNVIWGFPGEPAEEYRRMADLVPSLVHLPAPYAVTELRLDRFSPNFVDAERLGFRNVRPAASYRHAYPFPPDVLANLAYYFDYDRADGPATDYAAPLVRALARWRRHAATSDLFSVDTGEALLVWDLRPDAAALVTVLDGVDRRSYLACDAAQDISALVAGAGDGDAGPRERVGPEAVVEGLERLVARCLMMRSGTRYLSLAIPLGVYTPSPAVMQRFEAEVSRVGRWTSADTVVVPHARCTRDASAAPRQSRATRIGRRGARDASKKDLRVDHFSVDECGEVVIIGCFSS